MLLVEDYHGLPGQLLDDVVLRVEMLLSLKPTTKSPVIGSLNPGTVASVPPAAREMGREIASIPGSHCAHWPIVSPSAIKISSTLLLATRFPCGVSPKSSRPGIPDTWSQTRSGRLPSGLISLYSS